MIDGYFKELDSSQYKEGFEATQRKIASGHND